MPFLLKGLKAVFKKRLDVDVLDAASLTATMGMGEYRATSIISFLLKVSDYLEEKTRQKSRDSLAEMFCTRDQWAWIKSNGNEKRISIKHLQVNDLVVVRTGGHIPVDGVVVKGEAMVNQSSITGEFLPVMKRQDLMTYAGTAIEEGSLVIKAMNVGNETRISKIIRVIEESEGLKADMQSYAERFANRLVPYSFLLSGLTYAFTGSPLRAATLLIVDYSCAIKLSTPLAFLSGMQDASKHGVLIKGGKFIEKMAKADAFVLDKTGTLTELKPEVVDVMPFNGFSRDYILKNAACVEEHFPHTVASAVVRQSEREGLMHEEKHAKVEYVAVHGILSRINGERILVGSRHFIHNDNEIDVNIAEPVINRFAENRHSILYVAIGDKLAGIIAIEDSLRDDSKRFIRMLRDGGVKKIIMLTGDNDAAARNVAQKLGIREYEGQVLPDKKAEIIKNFKSNGYVVAMVGDGINDSPALSHADVGITMKSGTDIAQEASDVILLSEKLDRIIEARKISQNTMSLIRQNFRYIAGVNSMLIVLGLTGVFNPAIIALAHNTTTVMVAARSLRPYKSPRLKKVK
ncbi:heavy metal translocating P-type ATPase [candidate division NPL-UPA2 bacterium]|nr:heavy metal translocating P-type ATPase [candidate division NPL-UPA2 bacterium]